MPKVSKRRWFGTMFIPCMILVLPLLGACTVNVPADQEGFPCNTDGSCEGGMVCVDDTCVRPGSADCIADADCQHPPICHQRSGALCVAGKCEYQLLPEGDDCDDGDRCQTDQSCNAQGVCVGTPVECYSPPDFCPEDHLFQGHAVPGVCEPETGDCHYEPQQPVQCQDCAQNCLGQIEYVEPGEVCGDSGGVSLVCKQGYVCSWWGVCCDSSCEGLCESCLPEHTGGAAGACALVIEGEDPRGACGGDLGCDGEGACMVSNCGNGDIDPGETCDGDCANGLADCDHSDPCLLASFHGRPEECTAECRYAPVTECLDGDGCCPDDCTHLDDNDCRPPTEDLFVVAFASADDGNMPGNTLDGDHSDTSRWSSGGEQWIRYDFSRVVWLDMARIDFYQGDQRAFYLSIETSLDGEVWTQVFSGQSSGTSTGFEDFSFSSAVEASSVRINGSGNSSNTWNSYIEVQLLRADQVVVGHGFITLLECFADLHCDDSNQGTTDSCGADYTCSHESNACPPYTIPPIASEADYDTIVYVDPSSTTNGNGTLASPHNTINGLTIQTNTAYLLKRGTTLNERIFKDLSGSYIGAYGEGSRPIVHGGIAFPAWTSNITIRGLDIRSGPPETGWRAVVNLVNTDGARVDNLTVAECEISGWRDDTKVVSWPQYGIRGVSNGMIIYRNIIRDIGGNGTFVHGSDMRIVRNWVYNVNRNAWDEEIFGNGDGMQYESSNILNLYLAGNRVEPARDFAGPQNRYWKQALIVNGGSDPKNVLMEYNTLIAPPLDMAGGANLFFSGPPQSIIRSNVLDSTAGGTRQGKFPVSIKLRDLDGFQGNQIIKSTPGGLLVWDTNLVDTITATNSVFGTYAEYLTFLTNNPAEGSDIDPEDFWVDISCDP